MNKNKSGAIGSEQTVTAEDLVLINQYSRKTLTQDDVYTFSVVLCDNDIDRDFEYFTADTLWKLSELFVGVTGIYDHNPSAKNQVARIYSCNVENLSPKKTAYGEDYIRLVAKAYLPICDGNSDLIAMLDSGIKKEVSVGCGIAECVCSVCGEDMRIHACGHVKGEEYGGTVCCGVLKNPTDAYEWSFTAVPAQRKAGVIKSLCKQDNEKFAESFLEKSHKGGIVVSEEEYNSLKSYIDELKAKAAENGRYKSHLELETVKAGITAKIGIETDLLENMVKGLSIGDLLRLRTAFEKKTAEFFPIKSQLASCIGGKPENTRGNQNSQYSI